MYILITCLHILNPVLPEPLEFLNLIILSKPFSILFKSISSFEYIFKDFFNVLFFEGEVNKYPNNTYLVSPPPALLPLYMMMNLNDHDLVVNWLSDHLNRSEEYVRSNIHLTPQNVKSIITIFNLDIDRRLIFSPGEKYYSFYFYINGGGVVNSRSILVPEKNLRYSLPLDSSNRIHLFSMAGQYPTLEKAIDFVKVNTNVNSVYIYDKNSRILFLLKCQKYALEFNEIV